MKTGGRLIKHARYYWLLLAESHLTRRLFGGMLQRIVTLPVPAGYAARRAQQILMTRWGEGEVVCGIDWTNGISRGCVAARR